LLTGQRPFWSDLAIEVNADFIEVQHKVAPRNLVNQPLNPSHSPRPTRPWPGAVDGRFGPIQPKPQLSQERTDCGNANANTYSFSEYQN
jgi:hypothetical protein